MVKTYTTEFNSDLLARWVGAGFSQERVNEEKTEHIPVFYLIFSQGAVAHFYTACRQLSKRLPKHLTAHSLVLILMPVLRQLTPAHFYSALSKLMPVSESL
jgi:hypothetical protein